MSDVDGQEHAAIYDPVALFEQVREATTYLVDDPRTLICAKIESQPLVIEHPAFAVRVPVITGELSVEYGLGAYYRLAGAAATVHFVERSFLDTALDHGLAKVQDVDAVSVTTVMSLNEVYDINQTADRSVVVEYKRGSRKPTANELGWLIRYADKARLSGLLRTAAVLEQTADSHKLRHELDDRRYRETRSDFDGIRAFIARVGVQNAHFENRVPVGSDQTPDLVMVGQSQKFLPVRRIDDSPKRLQLNIEVNGEHVHEQAESMGSMRTMTIGNQATLSHILKALASYQAAEHLPFGADLGVLHNVYSERHARKFLKVAHDLIHPKIDTAA